MGSIKRRNFHDGFFFFFFSGCSRVTSAILLPHLSGMVDTLPVCQSAHLTS